MIDIDFIHIPKNCGTSIKQLVSVGTLTNLNVYDHAYDPMSLNPETSMFILRDPIDRFMSAFYYSEMYPKCPLMQSRDTIKTPSDLVKALMKDINNECLIYAKHHTIGEKYLNTSWVWTPQYYWDNGAKYVLFHDNLEEDFETFLIKTGRDSMRLPKTNSSNRKNKYLENNEIEYLMDRYKKDYELIEKYKKYEWK